MENGMDFSLVSNLHQEFKALTSYQEKVQFFDMHWGVVPFTPPLFDPELTWFFTSNTSFDLFSLFVREQDRRQNPYVKTFGSPQCRLTFSINPLSKNQRITLNQFIITKFLDPPDESGKNPGRPFLQLSDFAASEQMLDNANKTLTRLRKMIVEKNSQQMNAKFVQVFFKGYKDKSLQVEVISKRKRFIELFLYAQGLRYAQFMDLLEKKLEERQSKQAPRTLLLRQKLHMMEKMGLLNFLKIELQKEKRNKNLLIKNIYLLLSDYTCLPTRDENLLIESYLFADTRSGKHGT